MSPDERLSLDQDVQIALQQGVLEPEDAIIIRREAKTNLAKAQWIMTVRKRIRRDEMARQQQAMMEGQMQAAQAEKAAETEGKVITINAKAESDVQKGAAITGIRSEAKSKENMEKAAIDREEIMLKSQLETEKMMRQLLMQLQADREKNDTKREIKQMENSSRLVQQQLAKMQKMEETEEEDDED
jgi:hypothetical protein